MPIKTLQLLLSQKVQPEEKGIPTNVLVGNTGRRVVKQLPQVATIDTPPESFTRNPPLDGTHIERWITPYLEIDGIRFERGLKLSLHIPDTKRNGKFVVSYVESENGDTPKKITLERIRSNGKIEKGASYSLLYKDKKFSLSFRDKTFSVEIKRHKFMDQEKIPYEA